MKILVVDDNRDDRMLLSLIVKRQGHEAIEAENGQQGFELAASLQPDLIISDALMPVLDGFNFLKKLKADAVLKTIPFIFYSATYKADKDLALAAFLGATAYIFKPKEPDLLWREIEENLARGGNLQTVAAGVTDVEYLKKYSSMVATKLEEKVGELERALAARVETEKALQKAKNEWELTFESIGDIAMILSPDLLILRANRQAYQDLAINPGEELVGKFCYEVFRGEAAPCGGCPATLVVKDATGHSSEITHKELGKTFQVSMSPVLDKSGKVVSIIHFAKDITEQKKLQNRLNQAQKLEAIGTLAGGIAHDFNNILTPILGYAELAKDSLPQDSPIKAELEQVIKAAERAKELVRQILTFSRQKESELLPLQPYIIVKEALKLLRSSLPTTIEIRQGIDVASGVVLADPTQIHQIVMNLCTNAYHAMRETGGILAVTLKSVQIDPGDSKVNGQLLISGSYVVLEVCDTGCGMDKATMAKIFDPYFTTKKIGEGTGLGLSVVHGIVKSYGGHISVYSEPGVGTTFKVYLPRVILEQTVKQPEATGQAPRGNEKILFVDDDQPIVNLNKKILESLGYQVTAMINSLAALQQFQEAPSSFDLVVTDMTMPELNGLELSRRIRAIRPDVPIILCSGFSDLIDDEKARALGINEYLMKPILTINLANAVRTLLDKR